MKRGLYVALLLCGVAGVLLLSGASGTWAHARIEGLSPLPDREVDVRGRDLVAGLRAVGVLALAGVPALLAARRWGRAALGAVLLAGGVLAAVLVARVLADLDGRVYASEAWTQAGGPAPTVPGFSLVPAPTAVHRTALPLLTLAGGVLLLLAGLLTLVRGRSWAGLGARYEAPAARPVVEAPTDKGTWDALDRGEDPTAADPPGRP